MMAHAFVPRQSTVAYLSKYPCQGGCGVSQRIDKYALGRWRMPWNDENPGAMTAEACLVMWGGAAPADRRWIPWPVQLYSRK